MKLNLFYPCHSFIWIFELLQGSKDSFGKGSKRKSALRKQTKKIVFDVCATRWVKNVDGYDRFLSAIAHIVEVMEVIVHNA